MNHWLDSLKNTTNGSKMLKTGTDKNVVREVLGKPNRTYFDGPTLIYEYSSGFLSKDYLRIGFVGDKLVSWSTNIPEAYNLF